MAKVPLLWHQFPSVSPSRALPVPWETFLRPRAPRSLRYLSMAEASVEDKACTSSEGSGAALADGCYPTPLSPPYPPLSKSVELHRAMTAAARSGVFVLSTSNIIFEDQYLMVVNKAAGVYCEAVLSSFSSSCDGARIKPELHMANRLDRDTSGVMVITKSHKAAGKLVKAFSEHRVRKTYLALCVGNTPEWDRTTITSGHGRSKFGAWRVYSVKDIGRTLPGGSTVKQMVTSFELLFINGTGKFREPTNHDLNDEETMLVQKEGERKNDGCEMGDEILLRAYPKSGRTHQIRLHCQHLGLPIWGDVKYGGTVEWKGATCDTHALHAESLSFDHPITGEPIRFQAPLPSWASQICDPSC